MNEDTLSIAESIQYNLKNLVRLADNPSYSTIYMVICGQVDTLVDLLEDEYEEDGALP